MKKNRLNLDIKAIKIWELNRRFADNFFQGPFLADDLFIDLVWYNRTQYENKKKHKREYDR